MRKLLIPVLTAVLLAGCSAKQSTPAPKEVPVIESKIPADMDLTFMSNTVLMSEVTNMRVHPEDYQDKVVRLAGTFGVQQDVSNRGVIYNCDITDGTGCCPSGSSIQLFFEEEPENLPTLGENIIVQGVVNYDKGTYYMNMQLLQAEIWTYD